MSGFDNAKVDAAFFPDGRWKSNFLVNIGKGDPAKVMRATRALISKRLADRISGAAPSSPTRESPEIQAGGCLYARAVFRQSVAVVLEGAGLSSGDMQRIAAWTNLSETTFVLPPAAPDADYRLRIFTPRAELPFAGHPTIGSAHAVLEAGIAKPKEGRLRQECGAGVLDLAVDGETLWLKAPTAKSAAVGDRLFACLRRPWVRGRCHALRHRCRSGLGGSGHG